MTKNDILDIFTTVTGPYINFYFNFIQTLPFFFPGNRKVLHIYTDNVTVVDEITAEVAHDMVEVKPVRIIDLPHPLVAMQKTFIQKSDITDDMKYIFYFDIDTMFYPNSEEFFDFFAKEMDRGYIVMSKHPHYDAKPELIHNLIETNPESAAYIPEEYDEHVISSFWCGRREKVLKMCDYVNEKFKVDVWKLRYLPRFVDENYINKLIWEVNKGQVSGLDFYINEHLVYLPDREYSVDAPHIFMMQKYGNHYKESRKNF